MTGRSILSPVLSWREHDSRHKPNPWASSEGRPYVLDESGTPGVLVCGRCGCQVITPRNDDHQE